MLKDILKKTFSLNFLFYFKMLQQIQYSENKKKGSTIPVEFCYPLNAVSSLFFR